MTNRRGQLLPGICHLSLVIYHLPFSRNYDFTETVMQRYSVRIIKDGKIEKKLTFVILASSRLCGKQEPGMNRRTMLRTLGAGLVSLWLNALHAAAGRRFKYSVCNEVFEKLEFAPACTAIREAGYAGIEVAPFTLAEHADEISAARRRELQDIMRSEGVAFVGLHWLLLTPKWLHVTTADRAVREKSWAHSLKLIDLCADLG